MYPGAGVEGHEWKGYWHYQWFNTPETGIVDEAPSDNAGQANHHVSSRAVHYLIRLSSADFI